MTLINQNCYLICPKCPNQGQSIYLTTLIAATNPLKQSQKKWQSSILRCVLYRFHQFYHLLSLAVTYYNLLSLSVIRCHSLLLADIRCTTHCHFCHSLLFVVTRCTTRFHSLLPVVTRCITSLSFYKRLIQSIKFATTYSLKIDVHKSQKCKRENLQFQQNL